MGETMCNTLSSPFDSREFPLDNRLNVKVLNISELLKKRPLLRDAGSTFTEQSELDNESSR
jgi:hypothetical protein